MITEWGTPDEFELGRESHLKRNIAVIMVIIILIMAVVMAFMFSEPGGKIRGGNTYSNPEAGFKVQVPSGWELKKHDIPISFSITKPGEDYAIISIVCHMKTPLEEWLPVARNWWENLVSEQSREVAGVPAAELIFVHEEYGFEGELLRGKRKVIILNGGNSGFAIHYLATLEKYDKYNPVFEEVINSFELI